MPLHKQFDREAVLTKAMEVFWSNGFEATSMQDLVDALGINRGSLYATYGDKRALFIEALRRYDTEQRAVLMLRLANRHSPRGAIIAVFDLSVDAALHDSRRSGCFIVNTSIELSTHDTEIGEIVEHGLKETERFFRERIEAGQARGEIAPEIDAPSMAQALLGLLTGLRVLARSRSEEALLRNIARQARALLE
jgi:TetR/AcrR family transcriptional repressor of nem operon